MVTFDERWCKALELQLPGRVTTFDARANSKTIKELLVVVQKENCDELGLGWCSLVLNMSHELEGDELRRCMSNKNR